VRHERFAILQQTGAWNGHEAAMAKHSNGNDRNWWDLPKVSTLGTRIDTNELSGSGLPTTCHVGADFMWCLIVRRQGVVVLK
jgi:hypothetical protein